MIVFFLFFICSLIGFMVTIMQLNDFNSCFVFVFLLVFLSQHGTGGFRGDLLVHLHQVLLKDALVIC